MQRTFCRSVSGLIVVVGMWTASERSAGAHCLAGRGIYNCCCAAAGGHASTVPYASTEQRVVRKSYRGYGSHYGYKKPVIHRTDKLTARNRNGGIR